MKINLSPVIVALFSLSLVGFLVHEATVDSSVLMLVLGSVLGYFFGNGRAFYRSNGKAN